MNARARQAARDLTVALGQLEAENQGRLGVAVWMGGVAAVGGLRQGLRFGMCSSFKIALAALTLRDADRGRLDLSQRIPLREADRVMHAPDTGPRIDSHESMSWEELARSAQLTSDNVAANLLLRRFGGPSAFTALLRELGDPETRVDRMEPECNVVWPGDPRDTTTPSAYATLIARLLHGDLLLAGTKEKLRGWTIETATGLARIRAGLPPDWIAGDKTGTMVGRESINRVNDVAVAWPLDGPPVVIASYLESPVRGEVVRDLDQKVLAQVGVLSAKYYLEVVAALG